MRSVAVGIALLALAACAPKEEPTECCAKPTPEASAQAPGPAASPEVVIKEPKYNTLDVAPLPAEPPSGPQIVMPDIVYQFEDCTRGLKARGLKPNELWVMANGPQGACPNNGVSEARLREILTKDWEAAGCKQYSKAEMLHALDTGACGGDAG